MFNMGFTEILLLSAIALIFIGPKQLPELARVVGRLYNEFKRATGDLTSTFTDVRDDTHKLLTDTQRKIDEAMRLEPENAHLYEEYDPAKEAHHQLDHHDAHHSEDPAHESKGEQVAAEAEATPTSENANEDVSNKAKS